MALIKLEEVVKTYNLQHALNGVSFEITPGSQYVIRGPSGSGKSTLLYLIGGLDKVTSGEIWVGDRAISSMNDDALAKYRNSFVGFVFQFHFLLSSITCLDNMLLPAKIGGVSSRKLKKEIFELADHLDVSHCVNKFPFQLSGGEQQRINIIRALSLHPKLLLCDEPTGNLDTDNSQKVTELLKQLASEYNSTLLVVTHDNHVAGQFENHFYLQDGKMVCAPPNDCSLTS